jgi:2-oxo-3-hexenedioate decarboxylase
MILNELLPRTWALDAYKLNRILVRSNTDGALMTTGRKGSLTELETIAGEAFAALGTGQQISPFSERFPAFDLQGAYQVAALVKRRRESRGELPVGRKIGFTNRTIWAEYSVYAPIWGYIYNHTVHNLADLGETLSLSRLAEPRIEPEIVFKLAAAPAPHMDENALLACIDWVAHGFELVQSIFPGWKFSAPDTVAAYGLHGALLIGAQHRVATQIETWGRSLPTFEIDLKRDGTAMDRGYAANVLGGPVSALRHLVELLAVDQINPPLSAGEIVTTGTLTRALPVSPGETWTTELTGIALDGLRIRFLKDF